MSITINGTSGISGVDGSAATPALQGSDTNTGISFGADTVNVNTGGSTRATVDSSGRVLVGTSSTATSSRAVLQGNSGDSTAQAIMYLQRGAAAAAITNAGIGIGDIQFADNSGNICANILCQADGAWGTNDYPGRLTFSTTADGASSPTERMRINNAGYFYFKTAGVTPSSSVNGTAWGFGNNTDNYWINTVTATTTATHWLFGNGNGYVGSIVTNGSATGYNTSSDYRLKENVTAATDGIARLQQLKPSRFNFIADPDTTVDGFIAHEVQAVVPEAITGEKDAVDDDGNPIYQGIDQSKLVPLLTAALQEAIAKIETQGAAIAALETRLTALEGGAAQ